APRWRFGPRPLAGLAAVALVLAAIGGYAIRDSGSGGGPKTTTVVTGHSPGVTAEMVREGETGTLRLANLHQLPAGKVLQAWVQRGKQVVSAKALFVPNRDGTATATIDGMHGVSTVMVTAEPRGGSVQPTGAPIVSVAIPN
ncbi:MAG TPA: anti-sigma factor, partial [Solirubrobacterales bacterium]